MIKLSSYPKNPSVRLTVFLTPCEQNKYYYLPSLVVLQDVWHAMGRVIKTMSKGNFDYWSALSEFKKIFARLRDGEFSVLRGTFLRSFTSRY